MFKVLLAIIAPLPVDTWCQLKEVIVESDELNEIIIL